MKSIITKIFNNNYIHSPFSPLCTKTVDICKLESVLKNEYKIVFFHDKLKEFLIQNDFVSEWIDYTGSHHLLNRYPLINSVDKKDVVKDIDIFFSNIIKPHINLKLEDIKICIANNYCLELTHEQIEFYIKTINSDLDLNKEVFKILITERKGITREIIKKVSNILNLDENEAAILLAENGYKFKVSESDLKNVSLSKEKIQKMIDLEIKNLTSSDKIDYEKIIELCNAIDCNEEQLEKIISKYSFKEKEITKNLKRFVLSYNSVDLAIFSHHANIELTPMIMLIANIKNI